MKKTLLVTAALFAACSDTETQPTPGLGTRVRTSPTLTQFDSCDALTARLRHNIAEETTVSLMQYGTYRGWADDAEMGAPSAGADNDSAGGGRQEGVDFSGTNNQEAGVDEADFVKTDGYFIYVLNGGNLEIFGVPEFGTLEPKSTTPVEGSPNQMLIAGDKLVIFSNVYTYDLPSDDPLRAVLTSINSEYGTYFRQSSLAKLTVVNITDRGAPSVEKELYLEGYTQTGRKVEDSVRFIAYSYLSVPGLITYPELPYDFYQLPWDSAEANVIWLAAVQNAIAQNEQTLANTTLASFVPALYEKIDGQIVTRSFTEGDCQNFGISDDGTSRGFTSILSLGLFDDQVTFESDHIVSNWSQVYASTDTLVIAEAAQDWWWFWNNDQFDEATNIHRFDIATPGVTTYTGSGRVDGTINNQFNLSEHDGFIRVASTIGRWNRWWEQDPDPSESAVFVLEGKADYSGLDVVGQVDGIAPGEQLWSVRFVGDQGFLVTFRNIDPLWTIDLSNPALPAVKGELEVPGVSTYIHPIADGKLLTIGYGGTDTGLDWATALSVFDVSSFTAPSQVDTLSLAPQPVADGWTYAFSEANYEHKAFQYWAPKKLLAVPLSTYRSVYGENYYSYEYKSQLVLVSVNPEAGAEALSVYGTVDHSDFYNSDPDYWWSYRDIRRSIFMGEFIYAISDRGITAHKLDDLSQVASAPLEGTSSNYGYGPETAVSD